MVKTVSTSTDKSAGEDAIFSDFVGEETASAPTDKSTTKRYTRDVRTTHQIDGASPHRTIGKAKTKNRRRIP